MLTLDSIIGHKNQTTQLSGLIKQRSIPHAMLFSGPAGVGKRCTALAVASEILTSNQHLKSVHEPNDLDFVEKTKNVLTAGNHPDLHVIGKDAEKKELTVDTIREVRSILKLKPYFATSSVIIINDAHFLNTAAANALLMTLEEPPHNCYLILITHAPHRLLPTIISRCQSLFFAPLKTEEITQIIKRDLGHLISNPELLAKLCSLAGDSLDPLGIENFFSLKTSKILNEKVLQLHLNDLLQKLQSIEHKLRILFDNSNATFAQRSALAVTLAANLSADKDDLDFTWKIIHRELRSKMITTKGHLAASWADTLLEALEAQQMVRERNLNPQLQMSSVFCHDHSDWKQA